MMNNKQKNSTTTTNEQQQQQQQRLKKFICIECKNGFSNRSQLNSHIRTHTGND